MELPEPKYLYIKKMGKLKIFKIINKRRGFIMDIAALSTAMAQNKLMTDVSIAVLDMAMDTFEEQAGCIAEMMEVPSDPSLGQNFEAYF